MASTCYPSVVTGVEEENTEAWGLASQASLVSPRPMRLMRKRKRRKERRGRGKGEEKRGEKRGGRGELNRVDST